MGYRRRNRSAGSASVATILAADVPTVRFWDSLSEYLADVIASDDAPCVNAYARTNLGSAGGMRWDGNVTGRKARALASTGDPSVVATVTADVDRYRSVMADIPRSTYKRSIAGSRVDVPAYLGGNPECMRRKARTYAQQWYIKLYVCISSSGAVDHADLLKRGCAIVGLLEALQSRGIGVDLYLVVEAAHGKSQDHYQVIKIDSRPLDLSVSSFAIAHPAFARNVCYRYVATYADYNGQWARVADRLGKGKPAWDAHVRATLGMGTEDIYAGYPYAEDDTIARPEVWISNHVQQITGESL